MVLEAEGRDPVHLTPGDAFVIPPGLRCHYGAPSEDLELLEVTLPAAFETLID